jgi:hypothetical protein
MNLRPTRAWTAALGAVLALSVAGVAVAGPSGQRDASDFYDGDNAAVADPLKLAVPLKLYDASGAQVTSGSTTAPLAAYAAADGTVRPGDDFGSLFVHLPLRDTAPGGWPGVQVSGTDRFAGAGAVTAPGPIAGRPLVRTNQAGAYTLADVVAAYPNTETASPTFVGVYELRLRTSSVTSTVSDTYAAAYVKVTGSSWALTTAPELGDDPVGPVATSVTPTWPARITYGTAASVAVRVAPASGSARPTGTVRLVTGTTTLAQATLSALGTATLTVPRTALLPGSRALKVTYAGATGTFTGSESAPRTFAVAKARTGRPTVRVTKAPTAKKAGSATVAVPTPAGLPKATGRATLVLKKGASTKRVAVRIANGVGKAALSKLPQGAWTVTLTYAGDGRYLAASSAPVKLTVKAK